jgi:hypothetical protein
MVVPVDSAVKIDHSLRGCLPLEKTPAIEHKYPIYGNNSLPPIGTGLFKGLELWAQQSQVHHDERICPNVRTTYGNEPPDAVHLLDQEDAPATRV